MDNRKFAYSWIGYIAVSSPVAVIWHLVLFKPLYDELGVYTRKEPIIALGVFSMIVQGAVLAYLYPIFYKHRGGSPAQEGLLYGVLMGAFMWSVAVIAEGAKHQVSSLSTWLVLESIYYLIQFFLVGLAIGLIHGRGDSPRG
ncbi:MAG: DUF1761 domain-containing protein [Candidatus Tectomicrobia bacterium]|nr:DUF1761 domain-containing protein [Candidatus Tectomicrobia bacterium]